MSNPLLTNLMMPDKVVGSMVTMVSTSQTKFENADKKVDATSQIDFDDDEWSMIVNGGSCSVSEHQH